MPRLFGRSKSSANDDGLTTERKVKKSKSFKRIRGLIQKTRRKKDTDDTRSLMGIVEVDERSVATRQTAVQQPPTSPNNSANSYILKVVLLLMDPETRRFELLQLEFDSLKALVSDVLAQIPISVTEDALRLQSYSGIVGREFSHEMTPTKLLATFCKGSEVLVAVPEGVPPKECVRLAKPILSDEKVVTMLAASGIDASGWKDDAKRKKRSTLKSSTSSIPEHTTTTLHNKAPRGGTAFSFLFLLMMALILQVFHTYVSAPIQPNSTVASGTWLSKCGLLTLWPSCDNAFFHLDRKGTATYYNADKEVAWKLLGSTCDAGQTSCVKGMQVTTDGTIAIGGRPVKYVVTYGGEDPELSPWPFAETPKVRVWKK